MFIPLTTIDKEDLVPIILVIVLLFISIACQNMLIPSYGIIKEEFNIPEAYIAIPDAFFVLISAGFAVVWGYYTDRINRSKVILAGAFSWTIGMLLTSFSMNYLMLVISRLASGAGLGCVMPVGYSIISDAIPPEERSGWFGTLAIQSSISNGVGQGLSSFLGPLFTWRFPFLLLSGISIGVIVILFFVKIPQRGASEDELVDLTEMDLEYTYRIAKQDLKEIVDKKTNKYLILQGFFAIIPGTILIFFMTSMLSSHYFYLLPANIRLQTATIFAGMVGIGYLLGNAILSYISDVLYRINKRYRSRFATICMVLTVPFCLLMLFSITPLGEGFIGSMNYPATIPTDEIWDYIILTIIEIFKAYPQYIYYFIFAFLGSIFSTGWVSNKNAVMIDVNLPEHKGTATSFFKLSEQLGKGMTLLLSFSLITMLGSVFNMMVFAVLLWIPSAILWFFAGRHVMEDMEEKSKILSERKQVSLIDYIFEIEILMDRAKQKIQDSKYYIESDKEKFYTLISDAIKILKFCEREGENRSITNIENKAHILKLKALMAKKDAKGIYKSLKKRKLTPKERGQLRQDLHQLKLRIDEWEKSTFGELQILYEDAYLKIVEARLNVKTDLLKCLQKIDESIKIYKRVKRILEERLDTVKEEELTEDDRITYERERKLFNKSTKALNATTQLKNEVRSVISELKEQGINHSDLEKISELTTEYDVDFSKVITETFGDNAELQETFDEILHKIKKIFANYDKWKETEFKVF
ncbi:MAG: MFS transporter [Promethearchaeia archaeon]